MIYQWKFRRIAILIYVLGGLTTSLFAAGALTEYVGYYRIDGKTALIIRETNGGLHGEIPNRPEFKLVASGNDRFEVVGAEVKLVFLRNRQGSIDAVEIRQPLTDVVAPKIDPSDLSGEHASKAAQDQEPGVEIPIETLERYVGRYVTMGFYVVQITLDGSRLIFDPPGHDPIPLVAESQSTFKVIGREATVEFKLDDDGPASQMLLHENNKVKALRRVSFQSQPKQ